MIKKTFQIAAARILRPLVRMLIRNGVSWGEFSEVARRVFVEIAASDFPLEGRKQTNARIAMLTGIPRKEVARLNGLPVIEDDELDLEYNRGVRVTSGWRRDGDFTDEAGKPRSLPFEGENGFTELVRRYSGDLTARAVMDELRRVGTIHIDEAGMIALTSDDVHVPSEDLTAQVNILGNAGRDLFSTIDHNFESAEGDKRLQLTVAYNNLPASAVRRFQYISHEECLLLLKRFDEWLSERDRDASPQLNDEDERRFRAGIGMYYFEEEVQ